MKKRSLLMIVAMLSVLLLGIGTAHAVLGVNDDVPAQDIVVPIICGDVTGMNTLWAIADKNDGSGIDGLIVTIDPDASEIGKPVVAIMHAVLYNKRSKAIHDWDEDWTAYDIESFDCKSLMAELNPSQLADMLVTGVMPGKNYYVGYVVYTLVDSNNPPPDNRFVGWVYLVDLNLGFASGMNAIGMENGAFKLNEDDFNTDGGIAVTASNLYPRYYLLNGNAETWNWWVILAGRNQVSCINASFTRSLFGIICNETEKCVSLSIGIPDEMNIINVSTYLPASLHTGFPKAGFGLFAVTETGDTIFPPSHYSISGTANPVDLCGIDYEFYSMFGWAYQRAQQNTTQNSWDVIHSMHRDYCGNVAPWISGPSCTVDITGPAGP